MPHLTLAAPPAAIAAPLQHFSGELLEKSAGETLGLHQLALRLMDDEGSSHMVYIAHGRGDDAGRRCLQQYEGLHIGTRYHGTATLHRVGELHHWWMGAVQLRACQRRPRFELTARGVA